MEVKRLERADTFGATSNHSVAPPPPQRGYGDVLVSMGTTVGWGLWTCTSFILRKSFSFIASFIWKKEAIAASADLIDVATPVKLRKTFEEAPFSVIMKIIDSIHDDPNTAEKLLVMIAQDCKDHPEIYYCGNRKDWIMKVDEVVTKCLLSPKLQEIDEKALMGDMEEDEAHAISEPDNEWASKAKTYSERAREFRRVYKEAQNCKIQFNVLWSTLFFQLSGDLPHLDLESDLTIHTPLPKEGKTFGVFLERLLFKMDTSAVSLYKLTNFLKRVTFDRWADYTAEKLQFVLREKPTAQINLFCARLLAILDDAQKRTLLFNLTARVIGILRPKEQEKKKV